MFYISFFPLILASEMKWQRKSSLAMLFSANEVKNKLKKKIGFPNYDHVAICGNYPQPTFCDFIHRGVVCQWYLLR